MKGYKKLFLYGLLLASLIALLKFLEYSYLTRSLSQEIYIGLIAIVFTGLGIWTGVRWVNRKYQQDAHLKTSEELQTELAISQREMEGMKTRAEWYKNPFLKALLTYAEILPVGILISLISAGILKKKEN